jgi:hypothetical protein
MIFLWHLFISKTKETTLRFLLDQMEVKYEDESFGPIKFFVDVDCCFWNFASSPIYDDRTVWSGPAFL